MLYKHSAAPLLTDELFKDPTSEFRGTPFWAWNSTLDDDRLRRQIDYFAEMGLGGFHMHPRTGMNSSYLSDEFMGFVRTCVEHARSKGMLAYLYDEDRWPSGAAGGIVTKNKEYRARFLSFTPFSNEETVAGEINNDSRSTSNANGNGKLLAKYDITLENGCLKSYRRLKENESGKNVWYAYLEVASESPWYNNQTYIDTLNPEAVDKFIEVTHEKYYANFKDDFGGIVPSIFTDEPQFTCKGSLGFADERKAVTIPFTDKADDMFRKLYGCSVFDSLPEIFWELPNGEVSLTRYRYHDLIAELFARAFADNIGSWCDEHGILLTGHMMEEPTLYSQCSALGEAMRSYRSFQLPGIDMLCDNREYTTAKQAQSATHQYGREGVLSELYGVTSWKYDFRGHKQQGDWQAALGVTTRVPHLSWYSMEGEAKRDYPASIFYQSPWYKEYSYIENHFARVNTAMTRGTPQVRIGVIHPIESYWLHYGPKEQTQMIRNELENNFKNITEWLLFSQIDFDFVCESLLPSQYQGSAESKLHVGKMAYDAIIVPGCETIRSTTVACLTEFAKSGGKVIFMGEAPKYIDAVASQRAASLAKKCTHIPFTRTQLIAQLNDLRDIEIKKPDGSLTDNLIYQMRNDADCKWLFIVNGKKQINADIPSQNDITITVSGEYSVKLYNTVTGSITSTAAKYIGGKTVIRETVYDHDSLLYKLTPGRDDSISEKPVEKYEQAAVLDAVAQYSLSEPNVLLLDSAEYAFDGGEWHEREEILRIDNLFRKKLGYPSRNSGSAQPWTVTDTPKPEHELSLRFKIESYIDVPAPVLALENAEIAKISLNGKEVASETDGYFTDEYIKTVKLPPLTKGSNELIIKIPFSKKLGAEWCYILGDFGVKAEGSLAFITEKSACLRFGDYCEQGLPFYAGNVTYKLSFDCDCGEYAIVASKYRAPLLKVRVDGKDIGNIVFAPYSIKLGKLSKGTHTLEIISFGNRENAFGPIHNCNENEIWIGPEAWRTQGYAYSESYQLSKMGILKAPMLYKITSSR